jgi:hypothetical protein
MPNNESLYSTMVRSGRITYFVDVKEAKNGKKYLSIAQTQLDGEERKRVTLRVFGEAVSPFCKAVEEAAGSLA